MTQTVESRAEWIEQYLKELREYVEDDLRTSEEHAGWRAAVCADHWDICVDEQALLLWACELQNDDTTSWDAWRVCERSSGPFVPAYWSDRLWPPSKPQTLADDFMQWIREQDAMRHMEQR